MSGLNMFIPFAKLDVEQRMVYGAATAEAEDLAGEICDYASSKPYFQEWSAKFAEASGGKSLGNLRAMHGKIAAGKVTAIDFDDAGKRIMIAAKVVDDDEWRKVEEGVYTGFSQGGKYVRRWPDEASPQLIRFTAQPSEISLVDLPCLPGATFSVVKGQMVEERAFKTVVEDPAPDIIKARAEKLATAANSKEWAEFADAALAELRKDAIRSVLIERQTEPEGRHEGAGDVIENPGNPMPDGDRESADAHGAETDVADADQEQVGHRERQNVPAGSALAGESSRKVYEPKPRGWDCGCADHHHVKKAHAIACMRTRDEAEEAAKAAKSASGPLSAALDALEAKLGLEKAEAPKTVVVIDVRKAVVDELAKFAGEEVYDAGTAMSALSAIFQLLAGEIAEQEDQPDQVSALQAAIDKLKAFIASEIMEDNADKAAVDELDHLSALFGEVAKRGARNSKADQAKIQTIHDHSMALGAGCKAENCGKDGTASDDLAKALAAENGELRKEIATATTRFAGIADELSKRIATLEAQPMPAKAVVMPISKGHGDGSGADVQPADLDQALEKRLAAMTPEQRALYFMKLSLANPVPDLLTTRR